MIDSCSSLYNSVAGLVELVPRMRVPLLLGTVLFHDDDDESLATVLAPIVSRVLASLVSLYSISVSKLANAWY